MAREGGVEVTREALPQGGVVVHVDGELDLATSASLEEALTDAEPGDRLVIDLTECTFLDSSAVRVLVAAARDAGESGRTVALVAQDPGILRVLEIAAVDTMLPVHATLDSAL